MFVDTDTVCSQSSVGEFFLNPFNCQQYYWCINSIANLQSNICPKDEVFDMVATFCKTNKTCKVEKGKLHLWNISHTTNYISITNALRCGHPII